MLRSRLMPLEFWDFRRHKGKARAGSLSAHGHWKIGHLFVCVSRQSMDSDVSRLGSDAPCLGPVQVLLPLCGAAPGPCSYTGAGNKRRPASSPNRCGPSLPFFYDSRMAKTCAGFLAVIGVTFLLVGGCSTSRESSPTPTAANASTTTA